MSERKPVLFFVDGKGIPLFDYMNSAARRGDSDAIIDGLRSLAHQVPFWTDELRSICVMMDDGPSRFMMSHVYVSEDELGADVTFDYPTGSTGLS